MIKELPVIREERSDWDEIERIILKLFREEIYLPIMRELGSSKKSLKNASESVISAIESGSIVYHDGSFTGSFSASISKELKKMGARWDRRVNGWSILELKLPIEVRMAISVSSIKMIETLRKIDDRLARVNPAKIAEQLKIEDLFDRTIWKVEKKFQKSIEGISMAPSITPEMRKRIAAEYTQNLQLYIQEFSRDETSELRQRVQEHAFAGFRREDLIDEIRDRYGVSQNKAKFLARQETTLLMTKYKQTRYQSAGINEYKWIAVVGTPAHPTRPEHKALAERSKRGETFRWDDPPLLATDGKRKNPGQDYNCRCVARPVVKF